MPQPSAGHAIVDTLVSHGIERIYEVPGESFLDVLDGLHDSPIRTIVCRHEGGAAFAAEAEGKLTRTPGVAMVTRGPGVANTMIAVHQAHQDATPLVIFCGLVPLADRGRESFQEFDIHAWFGSTTKQVLVLDEPDRASEIVARAFSVASNGRPGPVVIGLPEDVIREPFTGSVHAPWPVVDGSVSVRDAEVLRDAFARSERPLVVVGGNEWDAASAEAVTAWAERLGLPILSQWRGGGQTPRTSPSYCGMLGYGRADETARALDDADLVVTIGMVLGDVDTDGYALRQRADATTILVSIDADRLGHSGPLAHQIVARPAVFAAALETLGVEPNAAWEAWRAPLRAVEARQAALPAILGTGQARMDSVFAALAPLVPAGATVTFGAGNHCGWPQRWFPLGVPNAILSSRNGSMGYSIPAAVAAGLSDPERFVVAVAGDGEFGMLGQEMQTAAQAGSAMLVIVMDNGQFGTIRQHQDQWYPGRVSGTQLSNPDFAGLGTAMGALGIRVERDDEVADAVARAVEAVAGGRSALLHVCVEPDALVPGAPAVGEPALA